MTQPKRVSKLNLQFSLVSGFTVSSKSESGSLSGSGFRVSGFKVSGFQGFRVSSKSESESLSLSGFRVSGFRVSGFQVSRFHPNRGRDRYRDRVSGFLVSGFHPNRGRDRYRDRVSGFLVSGFHPNRGRDRYRDRVSGFQGFWFQGFMCFTVSSKSGSLSGSIVLSLNARSPSNTGHRGRPGSAPCAAHKAATANNTYPPHTHPPDVPPSRIVLS